MKKSCSWITGLLLTLSLSSCAHVPLTGRQQLLIIPEAQMQEMSFSAYKELKEKDKVVTGTQESEMVKRVGNRLKSAVESYFKSKGQGQVLAQYQWEFNLFQNEEPNAFCMAGGKVGIHTGLLPITLNETGLAAVMGHEIAHAVANHGRERASQQMAAQVVGNLLQNSMASRTQDEKVTNMVMTAFGVGTKFGALLPFSRIHEAEADRMGLIFMAMAGYDPREAPQVWVRMKNNSAGAEPLEFMSTHPSNQSRIDNLNRQLPNAFKYYQK